VAYCLAPEVRGGKFGQTKILLRVATLAIVALFAFHSHTCATELKRIDEPVKLDFSLQNLNFEEVPLKPYRARSIVVHFLERSCEPRRQELQALKRFADRPRTSASVPTILVAESDQKVIRCFDELLDRDHAGVKSWQISALRTTYVLDVELKAVVRSRAIFRGTRSMLKLPGLHHEPSGESTITSETPQHLQKKDRT
jgi:hypothetical protein